MRIVTRKRRVTKRGAALAVGGSAAFMLGARALGYRLGLHAIVRCREGHLFSTIWIPGVNLKALDLVVARVQRCPVGRHWTLVRPVRLAELSAAEREAALAQRDIRLP
jgi:hypothetical protein